MKATGIPRGNTFTRVSASLADLLGMDYTDAVAAARAKLTGEPIVPLRQLAREKVDFFPREFERALAELLPRVGSRITRQSPLASPWMVP